MKEQIPDDCCDKCFASKPGVYLTPCENEVCIDNFLFKCLEHHLEASREAVRLGPDGDYALQKALPSIEREYNERLRLRSEGKISISLNCISTEDKVGS